MLFAKLKVQHFAVEKIDGIATLSKSPHRVLLCLGNRLQKSPDRAGSHLAWMAFAVKSDEPRAPVHECGDRRLAVSVFARAGTQLVQQSRRRGLPAGCHIAHCPPPWAILGYRDHVYTIQSCESSQKKNAGGVITPARN